MSKKVFADEINPRIVAIRIPDKYFEGIAEFYNYIRGEHGDLTQIVEYALVQSYHSIPPIEEWAEYRKDYLEFEKSRKLPEQI